MVRRLMALLSSMVLIGALVGASPAPVFAGTQGSCSPSDTSKVRLWENASGDTQDGNDSLWLCGSDSDLSNNAHTLPGNCRDGLVGKEEWNDCVSSATVYIQSGQRLCFYRAANYGTLLSGNGNIQGPVSGLRYNFSGFDNDSLSSFKFTTGSC